MVNPQNKRFEQSTAAIPSPDVEAELLKSKYVPIIVRFSISASGIVFEKLYVPGPNEIVFPLGSSVKKIMNSSSENVASSNEISVTSSGTVSSSSFSLHDETRIMDRIKNNCINLVIFMVKSFIIIN